MSVTPDLVATTPILDDVLDGVLLGKGDEEKGRDSLVLTVRIG